MMSNLYQLSPVFHRTKASDIGVVDSMAFAKAHMHMKRQVLPSQYLPYRFIQDYQYADKSYAYYDWMSRDFFKYLLDNADKAYWLKPGSNEHVYKKYSFKSDAEKAYNKCLEALEDYSKDYTYCWHQDWREIYRNKFPES